MNLTDCAQERSLLRQQARNHLAKSPRVLVQTSTSLLRKIGFKTVAAQDHWDAQFCDLTLLYPVLQAPAFRNPDCSYARRCALGHLLLMIHSVIEDRELDGQVRLTASEAMFSKHALFEAVSQLRSLEKDTASAFDVWLRRVMTVYVESQSKTYAEVEAGARVPLTTDSPSALAAGRASLGFLATVSLALAQGASGECICGLLEAYEAVVVGLQWADDVADWPEDFLAGRENLVIDLASRSGAPIGKMPRSPEGLKALLTFILREGYDQEGLQQACEELQRARKLQNEFGCLQLAEMIGQLNESIGRKQDSYIDDAAGFLLRSLDSSPHPRRVTSMGPPTRQPQGISQTFAPTPVSPL